MSDFVVNIDGEKLSVNTNNLHKIKIDGNEYNTTITQLSDYTFKVKLDDKIFHITTNRLSNTEFAFLVDGHYFESNIRTKLEDEAARILNNKETAKGEHKIKSPMPGLVLKLYKDLGEEVNKDEPILLLEAMKMENVIKAPVTGFVKEIMIKEQSSVEKNEVLILMQAT